MSDTPTPQAPDAGASPGVRRAVHGRFRVTFENAVVGMCLTSVDGRLLEVNPTLCRMLGYSAAELTARDFADITHPDDLAASQEYVRSLLAGERDVDHLEKRYLRRDGRTIWADVCTCLLRDDTGAPACFLTQLQDVTERKRIEEELGRTQRYLFSLLHHAPTPIAAHRLDGTYGFVNPAWEAAVGVPGTLAIGSTADEILGPELGQAHREQVRLVAESGQPRVFELSLVPGGGITTHHAVRFPIPGDDGVVEAVGSIAVDVTDLLQARRHLEASVERYRSLHDAMPGGLMVVDADWTITEVNDAACAMLQLPREQFVGRRLDELGWEVVREDGSALPLEERPAMAALTAGTPVNDFAMGLVGPGAGRYRWFIVNAQPVVERVGGPPRAAVITFTDITARRQAQAAMRESEERFRTAFEAAPIGVALTSVDGTLLRVNRAFGHMLGCSANELVGLPVVAITHPEDIPAAQQLLASLPDAEESARHFAKRFVHRDGHVVFAEVYTVLLRDAAGSPLHYITHLMDVSARRQAEAALDASEHRFHEMADLLPDMLFELDADLRFTYTNQAVEATMGYPQEVPGIGLPDVMDGPTLDRAAADLATAAASRRSLVGVYEVRHGDGTLTPTEAHIRAILGPDGEIIGYRGVARDITERRRAESERLAAIGQIAAGAAHDFASLLAVMRAWARRVQKDPGKGGETLADIVMRATSHGLKLTDALSGLAGDWETEIAPLWIESAIDAVLTVMERRLADSHVQVARRYQPDGRPVAVDRAQIERVFLNLVTNACQAMPRGGTLTIESRYVPPGPRAAEVILTFSDTGIGIAPDHLQKVFEPFFTTKGGSSEEGMQGVGLGLAVARQIVVAHAGSMTVHSELGVGTSFELRLPIPAEEPAGEMS